MAAVFVSMLIPIRGLCRTAVADLHALLRALHALRDNFGRCVSQISAAGRPARAMQ
jgi:hypothetical protein